MQLWSSTTDPTEPRRPVEFANHHARGRLRERPLRKRRKGSLAMEYLVEWAGYQPEWEEAYRQGRGQGEG